MSTAATRVRHDELGRGWLYPDMRARDGAIVYDLCTFDDRGVLAYVRTRDLHGFGVQPAPRQ